MKNKYYNLHYIWYAYIYSGEQYNIHVHTEHTQILFKQNQLLYRTTPPVTLLFSFPSPKAEIPSKVTICPSLKAIGEILLEISHKQSKFWYPLWPCYLSHGHRKMMHLRFCPGSPTCLSLEAIGVTNLEILCKQKYINTTYWGVS